MSTTPNMVLTLPEVLVTSGPQYATQINSALDVVDAHDHSAGKGVRITPSGLNINSDLTFANNQATNVKAVALLSQASVLTNSAIYNKSGNLFYRDGSGNEIQLTAAGTLNVSSVGAITGLTSPASASFVSLNDSFVFQNNATTYAKLEIGDIKIYPRGVSVGTAQAVTLVADSTTSAYNLNLPVSAPSDYQLMRMKTATASEFVDLLGTANQVTVTHNVGNTTLALPQNIHTGASPTFVGLSLSGAITGATTGSFSGALSAGSLSVSGNASFTGSLGSTITAPNYTLSLNALTVNTIGATVGSEVFVQGSLAVQTSLKSDTIAARTGGLITVSNDMQIPAIRGRISGVAYGSNDIGYYLTYTAGSPINMFVGPNTYDIIPFIIPSGEWDVSANVLFEIDPTGIGLGNQDVKLNQVRAGISTTTGAFDSDAFTTSLTVPHVATFGGTGLYNMFALSTVTRRIRSSGSITLYLVAAVEHSAISPINGSRFLADSSVFVRRVG